MTRTPKESPARANAGFIFATDGADFEATVRTSGHTLARVFKACSGFFPPPAGIRTVR